MIAFFQNHTSLVNALVTAGAILAIGVVVSVWEMFDQWRNR